jgi:hypothetical protein
LHLDAIADFAVLWMRIARQEPKALDGLAKLSRCAPLEWQQATGADWAEVTDRRESEYVSHSEPDFTLQTYTHPLSSSETRTRKMATTLQAVASTRSPGSLSAIGCTNVPSMCLGRLTARPRH